ncbi:MAG: SGNH/GDSL hydrolase family protein [Clostridiales bacterium]|nr:SGNH/GDSL hydrolase family protein [Clostridiales bacterium]
MNIELSKIYDISDTRPLERIPEDGGFTGIFRTIGCIGDSLSSGEFEAKHEGNRTSYHDYYEYSWGQYIGRLVGSKIYNFSRGGMTAKEYCDEFAEHWRYWSSDMACQCYIIALGVNDLFGRKQPLGSVEDIDFEDYNKNNKETFAGYYAMIIQRLKIIQPRARFFLMTMPKTDDEESNKVRAAHRELIYGMAEKFTKTYVLDFYKYAPVYGKEFNSLFMLGHMNPAGYMVTAKMTAAYIDYLIRHNMRDFMQVPFIGTDLYYEEEK